MSEHCLLVLSPPLHKTLNPADWKLPLTVMNACNSLAFQKHQHTRHLRIFHRFTEIIGVNVRDPFIWSRIFFEKSPIDSFPPWSLLFPSQGLHSPLNFPLQQHSPCFATLLFGNTGSLPFWNPDITYFFPTKNKLIKYVYKFRP